MTKQRANGILIHLTSLPGPYGIGDINSGLDFIDFLREGGQSYWQLLPLTPGTEFFDYSPYMAMSALAGNPLLISPDLLIADRLIDKEDIPPDPGFLEYRVKYSLATPFKEEILRRAFSGFKAKINLQKDFQHFCDQHGWVDDYALFQALKKKYESKPWYQWPDELVRRNSEALQKTAKELSEELDFHKFTQFIFFRQWDLLKKKAAEKEISLVGDIPIYVSLDSADVWANQYSFDLDRKTFEPRHVAGVPPDYFSKTGQRWGNPLYLWGTAKKPNKELEDWWRLRFRTIAECLDVVRIDHFQAFAFYWEVPWEEKTAVNGKWKKGPGVSFFKRISDSIRDLSIIAEDLGMYNEEVSRLCHKLGYPGMKVLQFAFDSDPHNLHLPHNFGHDNWVVYTGTHDNDTTVGWYLDPEVPEKAKQQARRYCNSDGSIINQDFIRLAQSSAAWLAVIPMQDVCSLGSDCRMNLPGEEKGNWRWRCPSHFLSPENSDYLRDETGFYARLAWNRK
ncbi:MAG: 4-alpha-glucanotransferase [Thermodesulfobacteriota bacterium]